MIDESGKSLNKWLGKQKWVTKNNDDTDQIDELPFRNQPQNY